jgi:hypothetical protein
MRLVKGAKETFGWVIVGEEWEIILPESAWERDGFQFGKEAVIAQGIKKSGTFGVTNRKLFLKLYTPGIGESILGCCRFTPNEDSTCLSISRSITETGC